MSRIFRQQYTALNKRTGKRETRESKKWYVEYTDEHGEPKRVPGFKDRRATEQLLADLEKTRDRVAAGLLTSDVGHARRPLAEHITDYAQALRDAGDGEKHVVLTARRIELAVEGIDAGRIADLSPAKVQGWLAKCRRGEGPKLPRRKKPNLMSQETCNHYIRALRAFTTWLVAERRCVVNPLLGLATTSSEADRRHVRRVLGPEGFAAILAAAAAGGPKKSLSGPDRRVLYQLAAYTGLRCGELAALTPRHLQLDKTPPCVVVEAADEKAGRGALVPLPAPIAAELRTWLAARGTSPREPLFPPGSWQKHAAAMLRRDLKAAGIPYRLDGRVYDFHALRSEYATALARAGVDLRTTQRLMRHSTPTLTTRHYTRLELGDLAREADKLLPPLADESLPDRQKRG